MRISDWSSDVCSSDLNIIMNMIYNVAVSIEPIFWIDDLCEMIDNLLQSTKQRAVLSMGTAIELRQRANREAILSIEPLSRAPTAFIDLRTERALAIDRTSKRMNSRP